jgi:hypothetical protein
MQPSNSVSVLLAILLIVLNGKAIINYLEWLRFKIRIIYKKLENERNNNSNNRSRTI